MSALTPIIITSVLKSGSAFALTQGDAVQDAVFIPGSVARRLPLVEGQTIRALLVPNTKHTESAQWLATRLQTGDVKPDDQNVAKAVDAARTLLHSGGVWTAAQVLRSLTTQDTRFPDGVRGILAAQAALDALYSAGEVVRVVVQHAGEIERACWYTRDVDKLQVTVEGRPWLGGAGYQKARGPL